MITLGTFPEWPRLKPLSPSPRSKKRNLRVEISSCRQNSSEGLLKTYDVGRLKPKTKYARRYLEQQSVIRVLKGNKATAKIFILSASDRSCLKRHLPLRSGVSLPIWVKRKRSSPLFCRLFFLKLERLLCLTLGAIMFIIYWKVKKYYTFYSLLLNQTLPYEIKPWYFRPRRLSTL